MNIWIIGRNYPTPQNKMSGSFELEQAKMLSKDKNYQISYLAFQLHPFKYCKSPGKNQRSEDNVKIFTSSEMFFPRIYPLYFSCLREKKWIKFLNWVESETGTPDVIHVHYPVMMLLGNALQYYKSRGTKIVLTEHWTKVQSKKIDRTERKYLSKCIEIADCFICVGEPLKNSIVEMAGENCNFEIIPNVVNRAFLPVFESHSHFEFIAVGRLVKTKQFDTIIKAFAELYKNNETVRLTIIGNGKEYDRLNKLVKELNIAGNVTFTGSLGRLDTAKRVANADCLICDSSYETFGVPIIEAWACGIPTISTNACPASSEYFTAFLGVEIPPDDAAALKEAMRFMYHNISQFDKKSISEYAAQIFSEDSIRKRLSDIYNQ